MYISGELILAISIGLFIAWVVAMIPSEIKILFFAVLVFVAAITALVLFMPDFLFIVGGAVAIVVAREGLTKIEQRKQKGWLVSFLFKRRSLF